jgi:NADH dehydrogenase FAD-containing subunit
MWTLVGGGVKQFEQSSKLMKDVLPTKANWLQTKATSFDPDNNKVFTENGDEINYEFLVVAMGIQVNYQKVSCLRGVTRPEN